MTKKTIVQGDIEITIHQATVLDGLKRGRLINEGLAGNEDDPEQRIARIILFPACLAATETVAGLPHWPLTFEQFCQLPELLVDKWLSAVYELNPHWQPAGEQTEEEKKDSG